MIHDQNLKARERVRFIKTNSSLDGKEGYNLGPSALFAEYGVYMIMLDEPIEDQLAINITEYCLEKI